MLYQISIENMVLQKLSWLHDYQYELLPNEYKGLKNEFNSLTTSLNRKSRRLNKILNEISVLKNEIQIETKKHNKLYSQLEFINKTYSPKSYLITYSKNGRGEYLQLVVKYLNSTKTIYLGSKPKVITSLDKYVKNLNDMNYGFKICSFLSPLIMKHFIKFNNPKEFLGSTYKMKDILEVLESEVT